MLTPQSTSGNTAIESASADKDVATLKQVQAKQKQVEALQQIFQEIDRDQENEVSFEDVKTAIASGELADFLESIGISTNDVWTGGRLGWAQCLRTSRTLSPSDTTFKRYERDATCGVGVFPVFCVCVMVF
ncbi:unnamed protein product [Durusdinium trenchii]|uniref:EF-hand domain-containing protein n=1 Tax=Durusdinium trenchii TaxID=1381693 RepID=A0ABP0HM52_9DINO